MILIVFFIPFAIIPLLFGKAIFLAIGLDPEVSRLAAIQIRCVMPATLFIGHYDLLKRWLACMRLTFYPMVFMVFATALHIFLCFYFILWLDFGIEALAIADSIKNGVLLLMTLVYCHCSSNVKHILQPFDS